MTAPEGVTINYISPGGTTTDITRHVVFEDAYFEAQSAAIPGSFHITVSDPGRTLSFASGGRIELYLGPTRVGGWFITQPQRSFFLPVSDTSRPVLTRRWVLDGVDYNLLLDKRILRRPSNYLAQIPDVAAGHSDHYVIGLFADYFDLGFSGGGSLNVASDLVRIVNTFDAGFTWPTQGSTMREVLDAIVIETTIHGNTACVYWVDGDAHLNWQGLQDTVAPWGFSDAPDGVDFIGWRDGEAVEDGSGVINEVFVWGGAPISESGPVVLGHKWNDTSINDHGRWQMAENRGGETGFKSQAQVNARANALISGDTSGTSPVTGAQGLVNPDDQYTLTWFAHDVPMSSGVRQHLVPGMVTTFKLWSFSDDGGANPYELNVPLRQMRITFPTLPSDNPGDETLAYVQFQGTFGLQMSDPVWWWEWLRKSKPKAQASPVETTNNSSGTYPYGSYFNDTALESADGSLKAFSITPPYIPGTIQVWVDGLLIAPGKFSETNSSAGQFSLTTAPAAGVDVVVACRTAV